MGGSVSRPLSDPLEEGPGSVRIMIVRGVRQSHDGKRRLDVRMGLLHGGLDADLPDEDLEHGVAARRARSSMSQHESRSNKPLPNRALLLTAKAQRGHLASLAGERAAAAAECRDVRRHSRWV